MKTVQNDLDSLKLTWTEAVKLAQNRDAFVWGSAIDMHPEDEKPGESCTYTQMIFDI